MSDVVIKAEGLGKKYLIGHQSERERYTALRDVLTRNVKSVLSKTRQVLSGHQLLTGDEIEEFWALKDVDFEIKRGDRVGIIGRNGAGKSTLLKILSRITEPSTGRVEIHGRVASLLEVGTGFHPELTGRENIYLNGAILGMTRAEIKKKFDEIVDFAGVEKFLDTPVKRYSSGMYVRLAFAVAAHLEPEILVVDEVLAVGDAEFQKKCLGKMEDVSKNEGRTVLFVSHNMPIISSLCNRAILLEKGGIKMNGNTGEVILSYYTSGLASPTNLDFESAPKKPGDDFAELVNASIWVEGKIAESEIDIDREISIEMQYKILKPTSDLYPYPNFHVYNSAGICVFVSAPNKIEKLNIGQHHCTCRIPANFLNQDTYFVGVAISSFGSGVLVHFYEQNALSFNVKDKMDGILTRPIANGTVAYSGEMPGTVRPLLTWSNQQIE